MMKNNLIGIICLSLAASIWGSMYVVSKYVLYAIMPFTLVWLRYIIAFSVLFIILKITRIRNHKPLVMERRDWILLIWIGFIGYFISISFQFWGTKLSDAHTGSLITSATPAFIVIFARLILKEMLTVKKIVSLGLATLGVFVVIGWDAQIGTYFTGSIILVGAAITWALLSVYVKLASHRLPSLTITTYAILFALIFTTPAMLSENSINNIFHQSYLIILGVVYLGTISTAGAFFLWNKGMQLINDSIGSLFFFFQPIVGTLLGWLLLKERISINFFIGGLLILAGVLIVTIEKDRIVCDD